MSEPPGDSAVFPVPQEPGSPLWKQRDDRRTGRRLLLGAIALGATLGAGLLFGARSAGRHVVSVPAAAAVAQRPTGDVDPAPQPVAPAPPDAAQQIVQALSGRAGAAPVAPSPATSAPDGAASATAAAAGAPIAQATSPAAEPGAHATSDAQSPASDSDGLAPDGDPATAPAAAASVPADPGRAYAGAAPVPRPPAPASTTTAIVWPARGPITSLFGPQHPLGIDIGIPLGTVVRAIADGRVAFAGGDACCSYGYYVDIDHGDGIMTRYGHLLYVPALAAGQLVHAGQPIGLSGTTGNSTGPHLHFEIRLNGLPVNPLLVLPR